MSEEIVKQELGPKQLKWVEALESDKYQQGVGSLCKLGPGNEPRFCCLGVACDVLGVLCDDGFTVRRYGQSRDDLIAPAELMDELALWSCHSSLQGAHKPFVMGEPLNSLISANDNRMPFKKIAQFIREHPEAVFSESR